MLIQYRDVKSTIYDSPDGFEVVSDTACCKSMEKLFDRAIELKMEKGVLSAQLKIYDYYDRICEEAEFEYLPIKCCPVCGELITFERVGHVQYDLKVETKKRKTKVPTMWEEKVTEVRVEKRLMRIYDNIGNIIEESEREI